MRLFIAVDAGEKVKKAAAGLVAELKKADADVKWIEGENLHLTLCFLGQVPEDRAADIKKALAETAASFASFNLSFDRLGAFGAALQPRVLWLGVGAGAEVLTAIAGRLKTELGERGVALPEESSREFSAHLTLGRVRGPKNRKRLAAALASAGVPPGLSCRICRLALLRSRLSSSGPKYETLDEQALRP